MKRNKRSKRSKLKLNPIHLKTRARKWMLAKVTCLFKKGGNYMTCPVCKEELRNSFSCNVNDTTMCIKCAYKTFPEGSPGRINFERIYGKNVLTAEGVRGQENVN